jgi:hypothetical protein
VTKKQAIAYVLGVLTIVGGGVVGKFLMVEAGTALVAAGAFFLGKIQPQARAFRPGALPSEEIGPDETTPVLRR